MRTQSIPARPMAVHLPKPVKKQRDPYDGLRPWSAITHGIGAVLGIAGGTCSSASVSTDCP